MIKIVGKVNLKQLCNAKGRRLFKTFADYLDENVTEPEGEVYLSRLAEITKMYKYLLRTSDSPYLVASLVRTRQEPSSVTVYIETKKITVSGSVANMMKLINGILNDELKVETLCWDDFDLVDIIHGDNVTSPNIDWKKYGEEVDGPEFFMELLAKAVCKCKEVDIAHITAPWDSPAMGPWQPKTINAIFTAIAIEQEFRVKLRKLSLNFSQEYDGNGSMDYEIGNGNIRAAPGAPGLDANVFAEAVCKLEEVNFCDKAIDPTLEEAMFKKIQKTPKDQQILKSLQVRYVTTKPEILASAAVKLTNLQLQMAHSHHRHGRLGRETWQMFSPSQYDQCAQTKAILEKIYSTEDLQLRTLRISLSKRWYTSIDSFSSGYFPKKKMEMVEAKMEKVEIGEFWQIIDE